MKIGLSTYSLVELIRNGEMSVLDAIQWIADNGGEHVEIVPFGFDLVDNDELIEAIRNKAKEASIDISAYSILANLIQDDEEEFEKEIQRVMMHVDIANKLGVKLMRHDVSAFTRSAEENTIKNYEKDLPKMVEACRRIADHAAKYGITTTVENHGFYVNGSDRVQRLMELVDRPNYKATLDVGNFLCVDEQPLVGIKKMLPYTTMVHLKDFYVRYPDKHPGEGKWFISNHGNMLRGAIVGQGEIDIWKAVKMIKESGYDGYISIEFEGMEDCRLGSRIGMENARRIWNEV
jgi:sugar phosphate isomerase/epimerase